MRNPIKHMVPLGTVLALCSALLGQQSTLPKQTYVYKKVKDCEIRSDVYLPQLEE